MRRTLHTMCLIAAAAAVGSACGKSASAKLPGEDKVLAKINGAEVTQYDVERALLDMFGPSGGGHIDDQARKRMLETLVESRAIAQAREKELNAQEQLELAKKVAAYREDMLVKQYLSKHTRPSEISNDTIREYYESHKDRFGGRKTRSYELLTASGALSDAQRSKLLETLSKAGGEKDWDAWVSALKQHAEPIALRRGQGDSSLLHPKLAQLVAQLRVGETSATTLIDGAPYVARVVGETEQPGKSLAEVSDEIRRTLAPVQMKQAVKQASDQVLKNAEVAYR